MNVGGVAPQHICLANALKGRSMVVPDAVYLAKLEEFSRVGELLGIKTIVTAARWSNRESLCATWPADTDMQLRLLYDKQDVLRRQLTEEQMHSMFVGATIAIGGADLVLNIGDAALQFGAQLCADLASRGLIPAEAQKSYSLGRIEQIRNKVWIREFANSLGGDFLQVPYEVLPTKKLTASKIRNLSAEWGTSRFVVLPTMGASSQGVRFIDTKRVNLVQYMQSIRDNIAALSRNKNAYARNLENMLLVPYVPGEEFSVEGVRQAGVTNVFGVNYKLDVDAGRESGNNQFFEGMLAVLPEDIAERKLLTNAVEHILDKLQIADGTFHIEFRIDKESRKLYLIEMNMRPGGGQIPASIQAATGNDLYLAAACCAAGLEYPVIHRKEESVVGDLIFYAQQGTDGKRLAGYNLNHPNGEVVKVGSLSDREIESRMNEAVRYADRKRLFDELLNPLFSNGNSDLRAKVLAAYDQSGTGLRVEYFNMLRQVMSGEVVEDVDAAYLATQLARLTEHRTPIEDLAEISAALVFAQSTLVAEMI